MSIGKQRYEGNVGGGPQFVEQTVVSVPHMCGLGAYEIGQWRLGGQSRKGWTVDIPLVVSLMVMSKLT